MNPIFCAVSASFLPLLILASLALPGCDQTPTTVSQTTHDGRDPEFQQSFENGENQSAVRVVSGVELESLIRQSKLPVLVEFSVDFACSRCDQMRPQIVQLSQQFKGQATVVRADFNSNRESAMRYGATICPSYVVFDQSRVVQSRNFPTSGDLLAFDLETVLDNKEDAGF